MYGGTCRLPCSGMTDYHIFRGGEDIFKKPFFKRSASVRSCLPPLYPVNSLPFRNIQPSCFSQSQDGSNNAYAVHLSPCVQLPHLRRPQIVRGVIDGEECAVLEVPTYPSPYEKVIS